MEKKREQRDAEMGGGSEDEEAVVARALGKENRAVTALSKPPELTLS